VYKGFYEIKCHEILIFNVKELIKSIRVILE
jgi:hypothetical protein